MTRSSLLRTAAVAVALTAAAGSTVLVTAGAGSAENKATGGSGRTLTAVLSGANEISSAGAAGIGDPDGAGQAEITINAGRGELCFDLAWQRTGPLSGAHIHEAAAGANGPIVVAFPNATFKAPGVANSCIPVEREVLRGILTDPAGYYVNFHTRNPAPNFFPGGAVRGQLAK